MEWLDVSSSIMSRVRYDKDANTLDIEWHGGRIFRYLEVQPDEFAKLLQAPSKSQYFFEAIRPKYSCVQIS